MKYSCVFFNTEVLHFKLKLTFEKTEANAIELVKYLMNKYNIPASNVIRHCDVTGKNCPKPFVENVKR